MEPGDNELMRRAVEGDMGSFDELMRRHEQPLLRFLWGMLNNAEEAKDAAQDAFLQAWRHRDRFNSSLSFKSWLYTIARNRAISMLRQRKHRVAVRSPWGDGSREDEGPDPIEEIRDEARSPREALVASENAAWLHRALERVDEKHRVVLQMKYLGGMKSREIADLLGLEVGTVWSRVHHGLKKLKSLSAEMNYEP